MLQNACETAECRWPAYYLACVKLRRVHRLVGHDGKHTRPTASCLQLNVQSSSKCKFSEPGTESTSADGGSARIQKLDSQYASRQASCEARGNDVHHRKQLESWQYRCNIDRKSLMNAKPTSVHPSCEGDEEETHPPTQSLFKLIHQFTPGLDMSPFATHVELIQARVPMDALRDYLNMNRSSGSQTQNNSAL